MALSRNFLKSMNLTDEQVNAIIEANEETIKNLKSQIETHKTSAEESEKALAKASEELAAIKKEADESNEKNPYKVKYEALKEEFADFKKGIETEKLKATKTQAYKDLLKEIGISDKRIDAVTRVAELDKISVGEDGKIEGADELKKSLKEEWADFIPIKGEEGAKTSTPPAGGTSAKTKEEILAIKDTATRQQAMLENKNLFL